MKLLVIGKNGQLGWEWDRLCKERHLLHYATTREELDICDVKQLKKIIQTYQPEILINCAAYTQVDKAEEEADLAHQINGKAVEYLTQICLDNKLFLVHYSTDYVFAGTQEDQEKYPNGYPETAPRNPQGVYGASKGKGEEAMEEYFEKGGRGLLIRVAWLCGFNGHNFVKTMLRLGKDKSELKVVNDQIGSPSYCENVVHNTWALLQARRTGVYHIGSEDEGTWFEIAKETLRWSGYFCRVQPISTAEYPTPAKRPAFSRLDCSKLAKEPGIVLSDWRTQLHSLLAELSR